MCPLSYSEVFYLDEKLSYQFMLMHIRNRWFWKYYYESAWKLAEPRFSLSVFIFIVKFTYVINTSRMILLKWVRSHLFTAQNPFHLTLNNNSRSPHAMWPISSLIPQPGVLSNCPPCWHSNTHVDYWVRGFAFVTDKHMSEFVECSQSSIWVLIDLKYL